MWRPRATWPTTPPVLPRNGVPEEGQTLGRLTGIVSGQGPDVDLGALDEMVITTMLRRELGGSSGLPATGARPAAWAPDRRRPSPP